MIDFCRGDKPAEEIFEHIQNADIIGIGELLESLCALYPSKAGSLGKPMKVHQYATFCSQPQNQFLLANQLSCFAQLEEGLFLFSKRKGMLKQLVWARAFRMLLGSLQAKVVLLLTRFVKKVFQNLLRQLCVTAASSFIPMSQPKPKRYAWGMDKRKGIEPFIERLAPKLESFKWGTAPPAPASTRPPIANVNLSNCTVPSFVPLIILKFWVTLELIKPSASSARNV